MPLHFADGSIDPITLQLVPEKFVIFYSSVVDGQMWCPDCRRIESLVTETFGEGGPEGIVAYVGAKSQWRDKENIYRKAPWHVTNVPTIIKLKDGKEVARLGDDAAILKDLATFVQS